MASAFTTAEIEDGSGKSTALVYYSNATLSAWLTHAARGHTGFSGASDANQDKANLAATELFESWVRHRVDGVVLVKEQALTFPRVGCTSRLGRTFEIGEIPADVKASIALLAEEHIDNGLVWRDAAVDVAARSSARASVTYRSGAGSAAARYPQAWRYASNLFVFARRSGQWAA